MNSTEKYHPSILIAGLVISTIAFTLDGILIQAWGGVVIMVCTFAFLTCTSTQTTITPTVK